MPRVLICDDALAFSVLFKRWMKGCGVEVVGPARTGHEAVAMAREHRPSVVVVDHLLPDATSEALVPRLRAVLPEIRVLLISSLPAGHLATAAAAAQVDAYISKAVSDDEMCRVVRGLMN